jgi:DNA-binding transcriptional LysR family regulator
MERIRIEARHLRLLRELAARGTLGAVAVALHRTPSAISQELRVATLAAGVALTERDGRRLRLTPAGRVLAEAAHDVAAALSRAEARLDALLNQPSGHVHIVTLPSAGMYLLPPVMAELQAQAGAAITVTVDDADIAEHSFAGLTRDADIVIGHSLRGPVPAGTEGLTTVVLTRELLDIAVPAGHPLAALDKVRPAQLMGQRWIGVPENYPFDGLRVAIEVAGRGQVDVVQRLRDNGLVRAMVAAGLGIAILPRNTMASGDDVKLLALLGVPAERWVIAIMRPDRAERAAVQAVLDRIRRSVSA